MKPELVLLRFGELTLKGKNRIEFEKKLMREIKRVLLPEFPNIRLMHTYGRSFIELNGESYEAMIPKLKKVFGIDSFSPVIQVTKDIDSMKSAAIAWIAQYDTEGRSFKVSTKRPDKHFPLTSMEISREIGGAVLSRYEGLRVDVHHPDIELFVEVRSERVYMFTHREEGAGGFPSGTNGKGMLMLSGGIDSPVAGWLAMRRGLAIEAIHFHSMPYTSERAKQKVMDLAAKLAEYSGSIKLHLVPFTSLQMKIRDHGPDKFWITLMRRAMFRIAEQLASQNRALAIVTGESLGQVASQTLSSMHTINHCISMPVLRPLITNSKLEIMDWAREIQTYDISIRPYEDCCTLFVPKSPSTNPSLNVITAIENNFSWWEAEIAGAVEGTEAMMIKPDTEQEQWNHLF